MKQIDYAKRIFHCIIERIYKQFTSQKVLEVNSCTKIDKERLLHKNIVECKSLENIFDRF